MLGTSAGVALITVALAACGADAPSSQPHASQTSDVSSPSPSETESAAPVPATYPFNVDKGSVDALLGLEQGDFLQKPVQDRVLVPLYYAENMPAFAADWYDLSGNVFDLLPPAVTLDMTPQQIVTFNVYLHRMADTIPMRNSVPGGYDVLDENAAQKMIGGSYILPATSYGYAAYFQEAHAFANDGGAVSTARTLAVSGNTYFPMSTADPTSSPEILGDEEGSYRTIHVVEADGTSAYVTYRWIVSSNGVGVWLEER